MPIIGQMGSMETPIWIMSGIISTAHVCSVCTLRIYARRFCSSSPFFIARRKQNGASKTHNGCSYYKKKKITDTAPYGRKIKCNGLKSSTSRVSADSILFTTMAEVQLHQRRRKVQTVFRLRRSVSECGRGLLQTLMLPVVGAQRMPRLLARQFTMQKFTHRSPSRCCTRDEASQCKCELGQLCT